MSTGTYYSILTNRTNGSNKFWSVIRISSGGQGMEITHWGKIGTKGQIKVAPYLGAMVASDVARKKMSEGYSLMASSPPHTLANADEKAIKSVIRGFVRVFLKLTWTNMAPGVDRDLCQMYAQAIANWGGPATGTYKNGFLSSWNKFATSIDTESEPAKSAVSQKPHIEVYDSWASF